VGEQPGIVIKLERRVRTLLRFSGASPQENLQIVGAAGRSSLAGYDAMTRDPHVTKGVCYLALHCISNKQGLYGDPLDRSQILEVMSQEMGNAPLAEVVQAIQHVKANYESVYYVDPRFFDRAEANALELMTKLPGARQKQAVTEPKCTALKLIPVADRQTLIDSPPNSSAVTMPAIEEQYISTYTQEPFSQIYNKTALPNPPLWPYQSANKGAFFIGGGVIAGAMIVSTSIISPQIHQISPNFSNSASSNQLNDVLQSAGVTSQYQLPNQISVDEAKNLIERWQQAKMRMFAPPYDQQIGEQLATGKTYADQVKGPSSDGTSSSLLEWLRQHGFSYKYSVQDIERVTRFESSSDQATIEVQMIEDAKLYDQKGQIQPDRSGMELKIVRFMLKKENGILKISDYGAISASKI
jgi:ARC6-like, IMS domain